NLKKIKKAIKNPHGMVLVTGPTGSGKTTSLYSILKLLNKREINMATIEDPV
ncbi:TPA: general secretion pathway protein GspE, partial [Candidatus Magasanikbacteria bacterium]|nr:general secretion pathway protein GspE [Candidatus Magasanikbacteria bacterium]